MPNGDRPLQQFNTLPSATVSLELSPLLGEVEPAAGSCDTLHGLFAAQARQSPQAVAVVCGDRQITYAELDQRANLLARHLKQLGIRSETLVGLYVDRSLELAIGLLAIAKSGAAYVPLDPQYPRDRLTFMLADSGLKIVLTRRRLVDSISNLSPTVVCIDDFEAGDSARSDGSLDTAQSGSALAYVMYTSGSTGQPKGVMIEHAAVANTIRDVNHRFQVGPTDRVLATSSFGFDLSVYDTFGIWAAGGCVIIPDAESARDASHWGAMIRQHHITLWNSVPASMEMLLAQLGADAMSALQSLRLVLLSGDWIGLSLPERLKAINPRAQVISLGGATEASIWSIYYPIGRVDPSWKSIPYGRALSNQSVQVLDEHRQECPVGVMGQLYIGGQGVARGYWNRPALTAERFVKDGSAGRAGTKLYATGDLGRRLADGNIEFLGRSDHQVKIRGYRVELGEIETSICRHTAVSQAVVLAREVEFGHKQLVAYVVAHSARPSSIRRELRQYLREALPEYMVPARFVLLERFPLTSHQKIDRAALAELDLSQIDRSSPYVPPTGHVQRRLVEIWQTGFSTKALGIDDDFFDLGGDSLVCARLLQQVQQEFGVSLSPSLIVERPTIRLLAQLLEQAGANIVPPTVLTIKSGGARPPLFCLPGIGGNVVEFRTLADRLPVDQPVFGIRPAGLDEDRPPHNTLAEMASYAIEQMRAIQPYGPYQLAGYSLGGVVAFEMALQLRAAGQEVALLALLDSRLWSPPVRLSLLERLQLHWRSLRDGDAEERRRYLRERGRLLAARLRRSDWRRAEDDIVDGLELTPASREVARVHWRAFRAYQPRIYNGPITLFMAEDNPLWLNRGQDEPGSDWGQWTTGAFSKYLIPGKHAEILKSNKVQTLASLISDRLLPAAPRPPAEPETIV